MDHLKPEITSRGFKHMPSLESTYGGFIRAYESSAADEPHIWINAVEGSRDQYKEATVHLTLENASRLRDQLTYLIDHHYHLEQNEYVPLSEFMKEQDD